MTTREPTTPDGHYLIVAGRFWLPSQPFPRQSASVLVNELMGAGQAVKDAKADKRDLPSSMTGLALIEGGKSDMLPAKPLPVRERRRRIGGDGEGIGNFFLVRPAMD